MISGFSVRSKLWRIRGGEEKTGENIMESKHYKIIHNINEKIKTICSTKLQWHKQNTLKDASWTG